MIDVTITGSYLHVMNFEKKPRSTCLQTKCTKLINFPSLVCFPLFVLNVYCLRQRRGYVYPAFIYLFVGLSAGLHNKLQAVLGQTFRDG